MKKLYRTIQKKYIIISRKKLDRLMKKGKNQPVVNLFFAIEEFKKSYKEHCGGKHE